MPNQAPTPNEDHVPSRPCIRVEGVRHAHMSSIDDGWETLSVAATQERTLPTVTARPRLETLPGIGPSSQPALAAKPRRPRRSPIFVSLLAAMVAIGVALAALIAWRNAPRMFAPPSLALAVQSDLGPVPSRPPSASTIAERARPLPAALALVAAAPTPSPKAEPPVAKVPRKSSTYRARQAKRAATDNPY